jgi:hypothetical protein
MMNRTKDIETRSYFIWEHEGRPQGRDWEHWLRAEAEVIAEETALKAIPARTVAKTARRKMPAKRRSKTATRKTAKKS